MSEEKSSNKRILTVYYSKADKSQGSFVVSYPGNAKVSDLIKQLGFAESPYHPNEPNDIDVVPIYIQNKPKGNEPVLVEQIQCLMLIKKISMVKDDRYNQRITNYLEHNRLIEAIEKSPEQNVVLLNIGSHSSFPDDEYQENPAFIKPFENNINIFNIDINYGVGMTNKYSIYVNPSLLQTKKLMKLLTDRIQNGGKVIIFDNTAATFSRFTSQLGHDCVEYVGRNLEILSGYGCSKGEQLPIVRCGKKIFEKDDPAVCFGGLTYRYLGGDQSLKRLWVEKSPGVFEQVEYLLQPGSLEKCKSSLKDYGCEMFFSDAEVKLNNFIMSDSSFSYSTTSHTVMYKPSPAAAGLPQCEEQVPTTAKYKSKT